MARHTHTHTHAERIDFQRTRDGQRVDGCFLNTLCDMMSNVYTGIGVHRIYKHILPTTSPSRRGFV